LGGTFPRGTNAIGKCRPIFPFPPDNLFGLIDARNYYLSHQYKMSAFGTKKPGGDVALQLTFPEVYEDVYAESGAKEMYYPSGGAGVERLPVGHDLQALYHEQKRLDANRMAMAGVRSRKMADDYARAGNAGYGVMPPPVLGQRRYANPSNGNQADIYAGRYDQLRGAGEMTGGVLRSRTGQEWGKQKLLDRVNQLNAIAEAKQGFLMGMPVDESITPTLVEQGVEPVSSKVMLDLVGVLSQFRDQFNRGGRIGSIAIADFFKALRLLFRVAPMADSDTLEDLIVLFDDIYTQWISLQGNEVIAEGDIDSENRAGDVWDIIPRVREYLIKMKGSVNRSAKERRQLSANLIKSLGITSFLKRRIPPEIRKLMEKTATDVGMYMDAQYPPPEEGDWGDNSTTTGSSSSSGDSAPRGRGVRFDPSPRANWASRSGAYFGEEYNEEALPTSTAANPMRRMATAEMPVAEARQRVPVFADFTEREAVEAREEEDETAGDFASVGESREDSEHSALPPPMTIKRKKPITIAEAIGARPSALAMTGSILPPTGKLETALDTFRKSQGYITEDQKKAITIAVKNPLKSQASLASELGVHQTTIGKWLKKAGV
jgi:hypothetical protein